MQATLIDMPFLNVVHLVKSYNQKKKLGRYDISVRSYGQFSDGTGLTTHGVCVSVRYILQLTVYSYLFLSSYHPILQWTISTIIPATVQQLAYPGPNKKDITYIVK